MANIDIHFLVNVDDNGMSTEDLQVVAGILAARAREGIMHRFQVKPNLGVTFNWVETVESVDRHREKEEDDEEA